MRAHPYCNHDGESCGHLCERLHIKYPITSSAPRSPTVGDAAEFLAMQMLMLDGSEFNAGLSEIIS